MPFVSSDLPMRFDFEQCWLIAALPAELHL